MHIEGLGVTEVVATPHAIDDLTAGQHAVDVLQQQLEQLKLLERHGNLFAVYEYLVTLDVHRYWAGLDQVACNQGWLNAAAKHGLHASQQLTSRVRLGHVVVGANLEANDLVDFGVLRGQHDDWHVADGANGTAHLAAALARKHEVQQDQVGLLALEEGQRLDAVFCLDGLVTLALQLDYQRLAEVLLVFNNQYSGHF